jgi:tRNA pseudouridine13 synthase
MFVAEDMEDARARCARFETSATGPMFGPRMRWPEAEARAREERVLRAQGIGEAHLARFGKIGQGTRRPLRVRPRELGLDPHPDGAVVRFVLPAGTYATTLTRELLKQDATALPAR